MRWATRYRQRELGKRASQVSDAMKKELVLLQRVQELLEREQALLRRELEMAHPSATMSTVSYSGSITVLWGVRNVKELLPEFDGMDNALWR